MSVSILHTADIHLDAPFCYLGDRGLEQREQLRRTFAKVCELAKDHDLMLVAGDLFDSNAVSQNTLDWAVGLLSGIAIPVVILPGTHDCIGHDCIYSRPEWRRTANVYIIAENYYTQLPFVDLDLCVHAHPVAKDGRTSPLADIRPNKDVRWNIAMAHGSVVIPGRVPEDTNCAIQSLEIEQSNMDYVALGHWHSWYDPMFPVKAVYPGAPEILKFDQKSVSVASVIVSGKGVEVQKVDVGVRRCREEVLHIDGLKSPEMLKKRIGEWSDADLILKVTLTGLVEAGLSIDVEDLSVELYNNFFHLEISDETHPKLDGADLEFPDKTVIGRFVRLMMNEMNTAKDAAAKRIAEEALQLGAALLQGKNILK